MRWSVYAVTKLRGGGRHAESLGYVNAQHLGDALGRAWKKWPKYKDPEQVQAGFHLTPYRNDKMGLGPKG